MKRDYGIELARTRVGLHSGPTLVGNFGGERRFNYTAYGQTVVIAARLETANKEFDTTVLVSESTPSRLADPSALCGVGSVQLKGVPQPVAAYTWAVNRPD